MEGMSHVTRIEDTLEAYGADCRPQTVEPLGAAGGFSGAQFWRLQTPRGLLCLRRWPREHPDLSQLEFIHQVIQHVAAQDVVPLPVPIETNHGTTFVEQGQRRWQLEPWLPGEADSQSRPMGGRINGARLSAAMAALARFHLAAESFPVRGPTSGPSPGIAARIAKIRQWSDQLISQLLHNVQAAGRAELEPVIAHADEIVTLYRGAASEVMHALAALESRDGALQPCIRDIRAEHVLFVEDVVSGLIDFGSMAIDNVTCDVARLMGALVGDDADRRREALTAYEEVRPLTVSDHGLVREWDRSTTLLSGMFWLEWIFLDQREFDDYTTIAEMLAKILNRLRHLASHC